MSQVTARALLDQLRQLDESDRGEAKRASAIGESLLETVCAFANEPGLGGGRRLLGGLGDETEDDLFSALSQESEGLSTQSKGLPRESGGLPRESGGLSRESRGLSRELLLAELPKPLRHQVEALGQRSRDTRRIESVVISLCALRPYSLRELATVTGRNPDYLQHRYLARLVRDGRIQRKYPDEPNRPDQAYITAKEQE